ncbi:hypothetical protein L7F22_046851 [Adiantum nelumboides]|nr:hypothetical protein [Adiantum nelumboides]
MFLLRGRESQYMKPVHYASKVKTLHEKDYLEIELVMTSMVYACRRFMHYLMQKSFTFLTSYSLLSQLFNNSNISKTVMKLVIELQEFQFTFLVEESTRATLADLLTYKETPVLVKEEVVQRKKVETFAISNASLLYFDGYIEEVMMLQPASEGIAIYDVQGNLVVLCDICGAEGFSECLAVCARCNKRAEHIYCVQAFCDALPPSWVCEGCKLAQLHACEKQDGPVVLKIDCNRTAQTFHEAKLQNKLCTLEQEQVEVEISSSKGRLNISSSLPADSVPQVCTSRDASVDNVRCMPTDCKSVSFQKQAGAKKLRHGAQGVPSSKEKELLPSFLLPSRPKIIPRSKNTCSPLSHVAAKNKAEQSKSKRKHMEETIGLQSRKALCVNSENQPVQGFECLAHRNNPHAGILEQPVAHGLLGKQPNLSSTHNAPRVSVINYPRPARSERHQPQFLDPYQGRPFGQHARLQNVLCSVSSNAHAHNVTIIDNAPIHVPAAPYVQTLWRGSFDVDEGDNSSKVYKGIQGHPSSKADQKVWEAAHSLPGLLRVKELRRGLDDSTWPKGFFLNPPNMECVGLFFFPVDMESHDSWYKPLVDRMMVYDLILRAESARLYLLIFHSQVFPEAEQLRDGRYYLWGMFRPKRGSLAQRANVPQSVQGASDNAEVIDMDIDSDDTHRLAEMSQELPLPPLPPGSPPPEPPPLPPGSPPPEPPSPVAQQSHEGDSGSPLVELSSSLAYKRSLQAAAMKSVLKINFKEGLVFSPFGRDILGGSSSCMPSQPRNQKASNGLERRHEEANLSTTTENCLAGHASSKGDGNTVLVQYEVYDSHFPNARNNSTSSLLIDNNGKCIESTSSVSLSHCIPHFLIFRAMHRCSHFSGFSAFRRVRLD